MDHARWTANLFASIDAKDAKLFLSFLDPDARFRYGNGAPAVGTEAIRAAVDGFFAAVKALSHDLHHVWAQGDHVICEGIVTYTRHDGRIVGIPFCNVLGMRGERVRDYRVYIDSAPLFAA